MKNYFVEDSSISSVCFAGSPPAYPVRLPSEPVTLWHGTIMEMGLAAMALATARTALGLLMWCANAAYDMAEP